MASDPIESAVQQVEAIVQADPGAHTVMRGLEKQGGVYTGRECVVVLVDHKVPRAQLSHPLPYAVQVENGKSVRVDVQEAPQTFDGAPFQIQILRLGSFVFQQVTPHQRCFTPTVPGGAQISPAGSDWVGTLGSPWKWMEGGRERFGFVTNRHVVGIENAVGHRICQPNAGSGVIGALHRSSPLHRAGDNTLDLSLVDAEVGGKHFVDSVVFGVTSATPEVRNVSLGDPCVKSGRTTGVTRFTCVGKDARTTINYGPGLNLRFVGLDVFESRGGGDPSSPGDSGSAIWRDAAGGRQFGSLLFAGGGGKTLGIPARTVQAEIGGEPFIR